MIKLSIGIVLSAFLLSSCIFRRSDMLVPVDLKCEYGDNPLGIETAEPELSWIILSDRRGTKQQAYRIIVSSSEGNLYRGVGDLWDSHKIESDSSVHVIYKGKPMNSGMKCWWKVRLWDQENRRSVWSKTASWETGLLDQKDWKAKWIGYDCPSAPQFRKEFEITKEIKEARAYICGLGYYELYLNGLKIGDNVLDPAQTDYEQRVFYVVHDVTGEINRGENTIGILLGNGWYNQSVVNHGRYGWKDVVYGRPRLIFQMKILFSDKTEMLIVSDETWKGSSGPVLNNNIYAGEVYDARLEQPGWNTAGFDASKWEKVKIVESPAGKLVSQKLPAEKRMSVIRPVSVNNPMPGVYVYDMGQNFAGWAKLNLMAQEGTEIQLRFSEWLHEDGMIDPASTGVYATDVIQTDRYICSGKGVEIWEPHFTYHGFRYVEMTGFPGVPDVYNLEGIFIHSSVSEAGHFECSDSMFNKLHKTSLFTERSNLHGIPTDCPHRERCGWLGDAFLTSDMTIYNFDMPLFWSKFIQDIETSRNGGIPTNIAPGKRYGGKDPDWGAAYIQLPFNLYKYYGDRHIIKEHYQGMSYFLDYLKKTASDNIIYSGIGSLFPPGRIYPVETTVEFTSTALYYFCTEAMSKMALAIGRNDDAGKYLQAASEIKSSFNRKFYDKQGKTYGNQEKNALALAFGLVQQSDEESVAKELYNDIMYKDEGHLCSGIFGSRYIYETLSRYGYGESIIDILGKTTFPGHGYLFSRGATTFWENWGEVKFDDSPMRGDERSKSHPFFGGFDAWFYSGLAGINPDPCNPGFKHIILKPQIISSLKYLAAEYNSIHGMIRSHWRNDGEACRWSISVPANSYATVYFPTADKENITENGMPVHKTQGVRFLRMENCRAVFEIGSGDFEFEFIRNN